MDNNFYNWNGGWIHELGLKRAPSKYDYSRPRFGYFESDGMATGSYYPNRALPVRFMDTTTERGITIPVGTIVSTKYFFSDNSLPGAIGRLAEYGIDEGGQITLGRNWKDDTAIVKDANGFFGYQEELEGLITIANGGVSAQDYYSDIDVQLGMVNQGSNPTTGAYDLANQGDFVAAGDHAPTRIANKPAGIVIQDVWQDIRGRKLNYNQPTQEGVSVRRVARIKIPYVVDDQRWNMVPSTALTAPPTSVGYAAVRDLFQFIVLPPEVLLETNRLEGSLVRPDILGKFRLFDYDDLIAQDPWVPGTSTDLMRRLEQKVGRFQMIDHRFPKSLIEYVDTYPGSQTAGTDTGGLTQELFVFLLSIYAANNSGALPTRKQAVDLVRSGQFGYAYIQVEV